MRSPVLIALLSACSGADEVEPVEVEQIAQEAEAPTRRELRPRPLVAVGEDGDAARPWLTVGDPDPQGLPVLVQVGEPGFVQVRAGTDRGHWTLSEGPLPTVAEHDHAVQIELDGLEPGERLFVEALVWTGVDAAPAPVEPTVRPPDGVGVAAAAVDLAPGPDVPAPVSLVVAGDLGGQGYCRAADKGYEVFDFLGRLHPDLLVANGDLVYADGTCPEVGPDGVAQRPGDFPSTADPALDWTDAEAVRAVLHAHWRYNQGDPAWRRLVSVTPVVAQWDDHEVINDFGAEWTAWPAEPERPGYPTLVEEGRRAFRAASPVPLDEADPHRIHRSLRWGKHLELFVVDGRSHRSPNALPDSARVGKKLIGDAQRDWLIAGLAASDATWKVVSIDVPLSTPTGSRAWELGRDGYASGTGEPTTPEGVQDRSAETGFEIELRGLLNQLDLKDVDNLVFVTTDVHHSRLVRYAPDIDEDGDPLVFHEVISGPLRAWMGEPGELDPTFGPESLYAEGGVPTATLLRVEEDAALNIAIVGADGEPREGAELRLTPR